MWVGVSLFQPVFNSQIWWFLLMTKIGKKHCACQTKLTAVEVRSIQYIFNNSNGSLFLLMLFILLTLHVISYQNIQQKSCFLSNTNVHTTSHVFQYNVSAFEGAQLMT